MIVFGGWIRLSVKFPSNSQSCDSMTNVSKEKNTLHFGGKGLFLDTEVLNYYLEIL